MARLAIVTHELAEARAALDEARLQRDEAVRGRDEARARLAALPAATERKCPTCGAAESTGWYAFDGRDWRCPACADPDDARCPSCGGSGALTRLAERAGWREPCPGCGGDAPVGGGGR